MAQLKGRPIFNIFLIKGEIKTSEKWWNKPIRAVTLEFPAANIKTLDVREKVKTLAAYCVNTINAFAISYLPGGVTFYQSHIAPKHPDLGDRDLLAEVIDESHKRDIKVVAYMNCLWGNKDLYEKHPDWAQRGLDGEPTVMGPAYTSVAMCPNSSYRDYFLKIVKEISDNYNVDGFYFDEPSFTSWCNCANCREIFREKFGEELPKKAEWFNPLWQRFIHWRYDRITDFKRILYEKSKKADRVIFFQHPFPLAFFPCDGYSSEEQMSRKGWRSTRFADMTRWYIPQIYGAYLQDLAEFEDIIHLELYRRSVNRPLWWYGVCARLGRSVGQEKPVLVLSMQGQYPFDLISLPEAELRLAIGEIVANNAQPLFSMYYPHVADKRGWELMGKCFKDLSECSGYLTDLESIKFAALLYSQKTVDLFDSDAKKVRHLDSLMGVSKALLQEHLLFDVITEKQLRNGLKNYKVLVLPNVRCMSENEKKIIRDFVKNGGGLVATNETSLYDKEGGIQAEMGLSDVFGVNYCRREKEVFSYDSYMKIKEIHPVTQHLARSALVPSTGTQPLVNTLAEAKCLASLIEESEVHYAPLGEDTGVPVIIANQYGRGRVVYFPGPIGVMHLNFSLPDHRKFIAEAVKWASGSPLPVEVRDCSDTVELTANKNTNKGMFILQLVNSIRDQIREPITHVGCERDIQVNVRIPVEKSDYQVTMLPEKTEIPFKKKKGYISFKIPELKYHKIMVVEKIEE